MNNIKIYYGDNLEILSKLDSSMFSLIYVDPPFNTGKKQVRNQLETNQDDNGDRIGYNNKKYKSKILTTKSYDDKFDSYLDFLLPRLNEAYRLLTPEGSLFVHLDYREVHYVKIELDKIFGRRNFINEIIWMYDYGARSSKKWSTKHDTILFYAKNAEKYCYNYSNIDRIPYMAPSLVGKEKAKKGKTPTDCWWHTIVPTNGKEKTGYPTQKPLGILNRIVKVHSNENDLLLDFFAGSGSFGEAAVKNKRSVYLIDNNIQAINVMKTRFSNYPIEVIDNVIKI